MIAYLLRRLGHGILLLLGVSMLLFILQQAAPGEFLSEIRLSSQISDQTLAALRSQYGLDQTVPVRYLHCRHAPRRFGIFFCLQRTGCGLDLAACATHRPADRAGVVYFLADCRAAGSSGRRQQKTLD
jgi:peptide/nickel transport system permease protein